MAGLVLRAADLPPSFVFNLPFQSGQPLPAWLGQPETPQTTFATLNLPILTPDTNAYLLVTVFFQEKQGGFLRIAWQGTQGAHLLSENFYEGIGMSNQRSLLVTPEMLTGDGTLTFQCGDTTLGIQRIKLEWLQAKDALISSHVQDILVTPENGPTQPAQNFDGQPRQPDPAGWQNRVVTVPITDSPQRIEQGVEFSVQLDGVPGSARLALKEAGLPLGKCLVVWINQQRAGTITPAVPDLTDDGYLTDVNAPDVYVGWRDGSFYVPATFLKAGVNTVQFSTEEETPPVEATSSDATTALPLAVKDVVFQLNYPPVTPNNSSAAPAPTNPVTPEATPPTGSVAPNVTPPSGPLAPVRPFSTTTETDGLLPGPGEMSPSSSTSTETNAP